MNTELFTPLQGEDDTRTHARNAAPSEDATVDFSVAVMDAISVFAFLNEVFFALNSEEVDLTLSFNAVGGLGMICKNAHDSLCDACCRRI